MWVILFSCLLFKASCFCITPNALQQFIKEYSSSQEKQIGWSKVIYAIEKGFDDIALFYIEREGLGNPFYNSRCVEWVRDKSPIQKRHILITCIRNNKLELILAILQSVNPPKVNIDAREYWLALDAHNRPEEIKERRILNVAIEECTSSLELVKILLDYGANLNITEVYKSAPYGRANESKTTDINYSRTPLQAAIIVKKNDVAKHLVERGANFNGMLPFIIGQGNLELLEFILQKGAAPYEGVESAIRWRNKEAVILLLDYGADPLWGIDLAVQLNNQEIIDVLMNAIFKNQAEVKN